MKPGFALSLSIDGITLLHRAAGGWRNVGTVGFDADDLGKSLAGLRDKAAPLAPDGLTTKLIIPNDQIKYLSIDTGSADAETRLMMARQALDGATPYAVDELAFDLSQDGSITHIAAVAIETLDEAETFAVEHKFGPTSFVAIPGDNGFLGEPFFGTTRAVRGQNIVPDGVAVVDIGPAEYPKPAEKPEKQPDKADNNVKPVPPIPPAPPPFADNRPAVEAMAEEAQPIAGFSSRRRKPSAAPALKGVSREDKAPTGGKAAPVVSGPAKDASAAPKVEGVGAGKAGDKPVADDKQGKGAAAKEASKPAADKPAGKAADTGKPAVAVDKAAPGAAAAIPVTAPDKAGAVAADGFQSRRKSKAETAPGTTAGTGKPGPMTDKADPFALPPPKIGGKPKFLGLTLVAALLLFMAVVAAWAVLSDGGLFSSDPELQNEPEPAVLSPQSDTPGSDSTGDSATPALDTGEPAVIEPQVSALPESISVLAEDPLPPETDPAESLLTETDSAVLDALRDPALSDSASLDPDAVSDSLPETLDPEAIADGAELPGDRDQPDLTQAAQYAATGIWQSTPEVPETPGIIGLDDLYVASIDHTNLSSDAVALPTAPSLDTDRELDIVSAPAAASADSRFELDTRGLVHATPEGTLNPDGVMIYLGRPDVVPPPTPARANPQDEAAIQRALLSELRPKPRPEGFDEAIERSQLGGLSRSELGALRPRERPAGLKPEEENTLPATDQAVAVSVAPRARPTNFANIVDRAQRNTARSETATETAAAAAPATVAPSMPSSASVARQATQDNAINLRQVNLIGVYGTPSNRRALVRLSNGRYKKVKVGDKIDGGQIIAIGDSQLQYQKGGRNVTLKMPRG